MFYISKEESIHFSTEQCRKIEEYLLNNPDKRMGYIIGIMKEFDGDYIWHTKDVNKRPVCQNCGKRMLEGTISTPEGSLGYPYWFCDTNKCAEQIEARKTEELKKYINNLTNKDYSKIFAMGIPINYREKTLKNLYITSKIKEKIKEKIKSLNNIFITGEAGNGKTHLAVALLIDYGERNPLNCKFINIPKMFLKIQSKIKNDEDYTQTIDEISSLSFIVLDDLGIGNITDYKKDVIYCIINERLNNNKQTIVTSNLTIENISEIYDERIASRIGSYKSIKMPKSDYRYKG